MTWDHLQALSVSPNQYFKVGSIVRVEVVPAFGKRMPVVVAEARTPGGVALLRSAHSKCNTSRGNQRLTGAGAS